MVERGVTRAARERIFASGGSEDPGPVPHPVLPAVDLLGAHGPHVVAPTATPPGARIDGVRRAPARPRLWLGAARMFIAGGLVVAFVIGNLALYEWYTHRSDTPAHALPDLGDGLPTVEIEVPATLRMNGTGAPLLTVTDVVPPRLADDARLVADEWREIDGAVLRYYDVTIDPAGVDPADGRLLADWTARLGAIGVPITAIDGAVRIEIWSDAAGLARRATVHAGASTYTVRNDAVGDG